MYKCTRGLYKEISYKIKIDSIGKVINTFTDSGYTIIDIYIEDEIYAVVSKNDNSKVIRLSTLTKMNENLCN